MTLQNADNRMTVKAALFFERLFLLMTGVYLLALCVYNATYVMPAYSFPNRMMMSRLLWVAMAVVFVKTLVCGNRSVRILFAFFTAGIYFLAYRTGRDLFLLMIPTLMIGAVGMDYHRILRVYTAVVGSFLIVTVLCALTGVIPNLVHYRSGHLRSALGIAYETDFASLVLYLVMILWLTWDQFPDGLAAALAMLSFWVSWSVAESRTSALCSLLLLFIVLLRMVIHIIRHRRCRADGKRAKFPEAFRFLPALSFLLFAAIFFIAIVLYARGGEPGITLNRLLSDRLAQTLEVWRDQGLHPFGSSYSQVGRGGSAIQPEAVYFIDSSYPLILIRYGWILFLTVAALWSGMGMRAAKASETKFLAIMTVVAFHMFSEHHFLDIQYNILVILPFATFSKPLTASGDPATEQPLQASRWATVITGCLELTTLAAAAPVVISRLRTVFGSWGMSELRGELKATVWIILLIFAAGVLCVQLCRFAVCLKSRRRFGTVGFLSVFLCVAVLIGMAAADSAEIRNAEEPYQPVLEPQSKAFEIILSAAEGKVIAEEMPELARAHFPGINRSIWGGDDLARLKKASVVVNAREDRQRFTDMKFRFTEVSPGYAVYSNDFAVIDAMKEAGYRWTAVDTITRDADLQTMAEYNDLVLTGEGTILLKDGGALRRGPYLDLYRGSYEILFTLRLLQQQKADENAVCLVQTTEYGNLNVLAEQNVERSDFADGKTAVINLSFHTTGTRNVSFNVMPAEGTEMEVISVQYRKTGR